MTRPSDLPTDTPYPLTFTATDQLGNTETATNTLIVADTEAGLDNIAFGDATSVAPTLVAKWHASGNR